MGGCAVWFGKETVRKKNVDTGLVEWFGYGFWNGFGSVIKLTEFDEMTNNTYFLSFKTNITRGVNFGNQ